MPCTGFFSEQNPPPEPPRTAWDSIFGAFLGGMKSAGQMAAEARARGEKLSFLTMTDKAPARETGG